MTEEITKLPRSSYEELARIIRGYHSAGASATNDDVAKVAAISSTIVSRNNKFLKQIGVLQGGNSRSLTERGTALAKALEFEMPDEIASGWRSLAEEHEFFQNILSAIRIRSGMEESALKAHIAYTAGESKSSNVMTGAGAVIDMLRAAGLITPKDGDYVVAEIRPSETRQVAEDREEIGPAVVDSSAPATSQVEKLTVVPSSTGINLSIELKINVDCAPADLDDVRKELMTLIRDLRTTSAGEVE